MYLTATSTYSTVGATWLAGMLFHVSTKSDQSYISLNYQTTMAVLNFLWLLQMLWSVLSHHISILLATVYSFSFITHGTGKVYSQVPFLTGRLQDVNRNSSDSLGMKMKLTNKIYIPQSIRDSYSKVRDGHDGLVILRIMAFFIGGRRSFSCESLVGYGSSRAQIVNVLMK